MATDPGGAASAAAANDELKRTFTAIGMVVERISPWLFDLGSWIFGALIAFNLLILGALLTVGPVDVAVLISTAALAISLPMDVAGFFLLRLAADMKNVGLEEVATQAFQEVGFETEEQVPPANARELIEKRQTRIVLSYVYALLALSVLFTLVSVTAALWHMAWWIGILFVAVAVVSQGAVIAAMTSSGSSTIWRAPSGAEEPRPESKVSP